MSKSKHNVVTPDETIEAYGADALRIYEVFIGPLEDDAVWQTENISGVRRFLERVYRLYFPEQTHGAEAQVPSELERTLHKTIQKVTEDLENMHPNTAISAMMIYSNEATKLGYIPQAHKPIFAKLLAPFAPHLAEEFWFGLGAKDSISKAEWPQFDQNLVTDQEIEMPVQVNGKVRAKIKLRTGATENEAYKAALAQESLEKFLTGMDIVKVIFREDRLLNLVVKPMK